MIFVGPDREKRLALTIDDRTERRRLGAILELLQDVRGAGHLTT